MVATGWKQIWFNDRGETPVAFPTSPSGCMVAFNKNRLEVSHPMALGMFAPFVPADSGTIAIIDKTTEHLWVGDIVVFYASVTALYTECAIAYVRWVDPTTKRVVNHYGISYSLWEQDTEVTLNERHTDHLICTLQAWDIEVPEGIWDLDHNLKVSYDNV